MMDRDCEHGSLARSCNICDLNKAEQEVKNLKLALFHFITMSEALHQSPFDMPTIHSYNVAKQYCKKLINK